jgi:hypothetical protein
MAQRRSVVTATPSPQCHRPGPLHAALDTMTIKQVFSNVHVENQSKTFTEVELRAFAYRVGLEEVAPGRYSWLFVMQLYLYWEMHGIDPAAIIDEIEGLESGLSGVGTKPATAFTCAPLKGLWHKHFFSARFLAHNLLIEHSGGRLRTLVEDVMDSAKSPVVTVGMISELSHRLVKDAFESRWSQHKITGEWIIFAKYDGEHYYLSLSTHNVGDQAIYDQLDSVCFLQFPFLRASQASQ